jgi:aminopeptidase-like protein
MENETEVEWLNKLFDELWPITRSITGPGLRKSLSIFERHIPLDVVGVPSGTDVFDWEVPEEWRIYEARLTGPEGDVYADIDKNNLHVLNYSKPTDTRLPLDELKPHLYTEPDVPDAIPYVTSYYERRWGFCLPHKVYENLPEGEYHAYIDTEFVDGELNYGHAVLPGESDQEFLLSSYLCHPSLANNELSGPLVLTALYRRLLEWDKRRYTYRFVLCPETIGSIAYLHEHGDHLKDSLVGGLVLTCLGGPKDRLSYKTSRQEDALIDKTVRNLKNQAGTEFEIRPFTPTGGSDERQYCSPGFDLPVGQIARTVYGEYEGYHNSKDDKEFMRIESLVESVDMIEDLLRAFEYAGYYENQEPYGEPMLGKRDLYPNVNSPRRWDDTDLVVDEQEFLNRILTVLSYSDGNNPMVDIAEDYGCPVGEMIPVVKTLEEHDLLRRRNRKER